VVEVDEFRGDPIVRGSRSGNGGVGTSFSQLKH